MWNNVNSIWVHQLLFSISVQFSRSLVSDSLQPHGLQHARPPCPSPTPRVYSNSCPLSRWCHPIISSSVIPFSSCLQSFPASGSFQMIQLFFSIYLSIFPLCPWIGCIIILLWFIVRNMYLVFSCFWHTAPNTLGISYVIRWEKFLDIHKNSPSTTPEFMLMMWLAGRVVCLERAWKLCTFPQLLPYTSFLTVPELHPFTANQQSNKKAFLWILWATLANSLNSRRGSWELPVYSPQHWLQTKLGTGFWSGQWGSLEELSP